MLPRITPALLLLLLLGLCSSATEAFTCTPPKVIQRQQSTQLEASRRDVLGSLLVTPVAIFAGTANAAAPKEASPLAEKMSVEDAKTRFQLARTDLKYLLENYGEVAQGGGDAVRNYLGTQGVNRNMYGIQKVLKLLKEEADDIVEFTETMEDFNAYYYQAEGAAYQSMFAEHSSAKATPESLLATAKQDLVQMVKYMDQLAVQLNL